MKINSNNLNKMIQSAFSKEIIFSYFPLDIKLKVFNISKHYQSLFKLSILDYEVFRSFKLTFPFLIDLISVPVNTIPASIVSIIV